MEGPAFQTFNQTFESEQVFCDFRSSSLSSFFVIFGNFGIEQFPKFLNVWKTLFPNFSELFQTLSELFDTKTGFFDSKTQT